MDKTILITGASSGIGYATAMHFYSKGWKVITTVRDKKDRAIFQPKKDIGVYVLDIANRKTIGAVIGSIIESVGRLDVLVNNAGLGVEGPLETTKEEDIEEIVRVNVLGVFYLTRKIIEHFRTQGGGIIVNLSSTAGRTTFPFYALYHGTKWAVEGFSESLQYELAPLNIKVKIIEPGLIATAFYEKMAARVERVIPNDYKQLWSRLSASKERIRKMSHSPDIVARAIYQAATDGSWQLRYPVGIDARILILARRLLPERVFFWLVQKSIGE
ncbi:SDR family oxidoreductase [Candidatus Gottesmanbacteria bacterium]|nr:SDR family oxidoreductase [Candidatus Gottesmanbacteria bacterium]